VEVLQNRLIRSSVSISAPKKMAIIWTKSTCDGHFEVRRAGNSVRLYRNGVFHSQFNPRNPVSATPWSLLLLPAYFRPAEAIRRALVLGVGGGAVIRLLRQCVQPEEIIGVELDPVHISVARRFFRVTPDVADMVQADATSWLRAYKGPKFDLIIDDLYGESEGEPLRAVESDTGWLSTLTTNLSREGVLVMNFVRSQDLRDSAALLKGLRSNPLDAAFRLSLADYENVVGAFMRPDSVTKPLRQMLRMTGAPCGAALAKLPYQIRRVSR
jgi:hypothetical protein